MLIKFCKTYLEFSAKKTDTVVLFTWEQLMVFRLKDKTTVHFSGIVRREAGFANADVCKSGYLVASDPEQSWRWSPVNPDGTGDRPPPIPTILSTLWGLVFELLPMNTEGRGDPPDTNALAKFLSFPSRREPGRDTNPNPPPSSGGRGNSHGGLAGSRTPGPSAQGFKTLTLLKTHIVPPPDLPLPDLRYATHTVTDVEVSDSTDKVEPMLGAITFLDYQPPCDCSTEIVMDDLDCTFHLDHLYFELCSDLDGPSHPRVLEFVSSPLLPVPGVAQLALGPDNGNGNLGSGRTWTAYAGDLWEPPLAAGVVIPAMPSSKSTMHGSPSSKTESSGTSEDTDLMTPDLLHICPPIKAVVRFSCPELAEYDSSHDVSGMHTSEEQMLAAIYNEDRSYQRVYKPAQGVTVPTYHGLYRAALPSRVVLKGSNGPSTDVDATTRPYLYAMILGRAGDLIADSWNELDWSQK